MCLFEDRCSTEQNVCSLTTTIFVYIRNGLFVTKNYMFFENRTSMFSVCEDDNDDESGNNNTPRRWNLLSIFSSYITNTYGERTNTHTFSVDVNVCRECAFLLPNIHFIGKPFLSLVINAKSFENKLSYRSTQCKLLLPLIMFKFTTRVTHTLRKWRSEHRTNNIIKLCIDCIVEMRYLLRKRDALVNVKYVTLQMLLK